VALEGVEELAGAGVEEGDGAVHGAARDPASVGTVRHALCRRKEETKGGLSQGGETLTIENKWLGNKGLFEE
jgi:hypothetical protein